MVSEACREEHREGEVEMTLQEFTPDPAERMNKKLPTPSASQLPELIRENYGAWGDRKFHENGIIEHISKTGDSLFTIKLRLRPNSMLSWKTLRKLVEVADTYGMKSVRAT